MKSHRGPLDPLTAEEADLARELHADVQKLAGDIGIRNHYRQAALVEAERYVADRLQSTRRQAFRVGVNEAANVEFELRGTTRPDEVLVIGAHYDSAPGTPGANDNGTGVAAVLALADRARARPAARTLRFVAFVNEEPPYFKTDAMGSLRYARACHDRGERVVGMLSLETIGCYSDEPGSQWYPPPIGLLHPSTGNFIGFVSNLRSKPFLQQVVDSFRRHTRFPSEHAALPSWFPGADLSDQWAFWQQGYSAVMVTDTAPFRYAHYHRITDTPDRIDYARTARVVAGLDRVVRELAERS
jgi:Zn-dependent M28 family amino/carboxypeptidase